MTEFPTELPTELTKDQIEDIMIGVNDQLDELILLASLAKIFLFHPEEDSLKARLSEIESKIYTRTECLAARSEILSSLGYYRASKLSQKIHSNENKD